MFDSNTANFSGIATGEDLHLSKIVHKAKISVNKDGKKPCPMDISLISVRKNSTE